MRRFVAMACVAWSVLLGLLAGGCVGSGTTTKPRPADAKPPAEISLAQPVYGIDEESLTTMRRLRETRIAFASLDDVQFWDVLDYFREVSGLSISINWGGFVECDSPEIRTRGLNVRLQNVTLQKLLETILEEETGGSLVMLRYRIEGGVICIDAIEHGAEPTVIRLYDIRDLLPTGKGEKAGADRLEQLAVWITARRCFCPEGPTAYIVHDGILILRQTEERHRKMLRFLEMLRRANPTIPHDGPVLWKPTRVDRADVTVRGIDPKDRAVMEALAAKRAAKVRLIDVQACDALDYFQEVTGIPVRVDWDELAKDNPEMPSKQINQVLVDVTCGPLLERLLCDMGGGFVETGYSIRDGVIVVSLQKEIDKRLVQREYDICCLLSPGAGASAEAERIGELVMTVVDRESWRPTGSARVSARDGALVVKQTERNHRLVQRFLTDLRAAELGSQADVASMKAPELAGKRRLEPGTMPVMGIDEASRRALRCLQENRVDRVSLVDVPFPEALDWFRDNAGLSLYVNWGALETENPEIRKKKVTVEMRDATCESLLEAILTEAAGGEIGIGYEIRGGVLHVDSQDHLNANTTVELYDIRDLVPTGEDIDSQARRIGDRIKTAVDPDSWYPLGRAYADVYGGILIVEQTWRNHQRIRRFLETLPKGSPSGSESRRAK